MSNTVSENYKSLKIVLRPTEVQKEFFNKSIGCMRLAYNEQLDHKINFYTENILPLKETSSKQEIAKVWKTYKDLLASELKIKYPFMKEVSDWAIQNGIRRCNIAFDNFIKSQKGLRRGQKVGFPKYKSKKEPIQSFQMFNVSKRKHFDWNSKTVKIPKIGKVEFFKRRLPKWWNLVDKFGTVAITKTASGKFYVSILCQLRKDFKVVTFNRKDSIGLDFSPKNCCVDSNNKTGKDFGYKPQKQRLKIKRKLRGLQKSYRRKLLVPFKNKNNRNPDFKSVKDKIEFKELNKQQSFKNLEKTRIKLARLNEKISNRRDFWIQNETKRLVSNYDRIVIEDLNLQGMMKGFCNSKNYVDSSWGRFTNLLEQKGKTFSCKIIKADRFFPSTKLCHVCGFKNESLTLKDRVWICPDCQTLHNRDHNAAMNLKNYDTDKTSGIGAEAPTTTEFQTKGFSSKTRDVEVVTQKAMTERKAVGSLGPQ